MCRRLAEAQADHSWPLKGQRVLEFRYQYPVAVPVSTSCLPKMVSSTFPDHTALRATIDRRAYRSFQSWCEKSLCTRAAIGKNDGGSDCDALCMMVALMVRWGLSRNNVSVHTPGASTLQYVPTFTREESETG